MGFAIEIFVFAFLPAQDALPGVFNNQASLGIVLAMAAVCGLCAALLIGTLFGFAAMFPPQYMTAVMSGNGVAGVIVFGLKAAVKYGFKDDPTGPQKSSITFFSVAGGVILLCFIALLLMPRLQYVQYHIKKSASSVQSSPSDAINDGTLLTDPTRNKYEPSLMRLFSQFWTQALNVFWIFFVTLSLFPGILFNVQASWADEKQWIGVLLTGTFQVGDFIGRTLPRFVTKVKDDGEVVVLVPRRWNWVLTMLHTIFFPLIVLIAVPRAPFQAILSNNAWAFTFVGLFSISNGFSGTIPMIYGPSSVDSSQASRVGTIMAICLNAGIFLGSHMSFLMLWAINPAALRALVGL